MPLYALFRLGFPPAPGLLSLNLATCGNSQAHSTKGTPSPSRALTACRSTVSGSLSLPSRGPFHLSLTVLCAIGSRRVFSLGGWSPLLPAGFLVSRRTQDRVPCGLVDFAYGDFTLSVGPSQTLRLSTGFLTARGRPPNASYNPTHDISFDFSSCRYLDGSLPCVSPPCTMCSCIGWMSSRHPGYPIRTSRDRGILAPPPGFSQLVTSFFVWRLPGILRGP